MDRSLWIVDPSKELVAGPGFDLAQWPTDARPGFAGSRKSGKRALRAASAMLAEQQERFYAAGVDADLVAKEGGEAHGSLSPTPDTAVARPSVLLVLQGMDTAGKGGTVKHVVGAVDPQGVEYAAFKKPTEEELQHDFLWRIRKHLPGPGVLSVFDRSHYEDVLIGRVRHLAPPEEIERRYCAINDFERELVDSGTRVLKVMLHVGYDEQGKRLMHRLDRPDKYWKFNPDDVSERGLWNEYQQAYRVALQSTSTDYAPWYVVPADHKWYARLAVQQLLIEVLEDFDLGWPPARFDIEEQKLRLRKISRTPR